MPVIRRAMEPADVSTCMRMLASDPVVTNRSSGSIHDMETALRSVIDREALCAVVFESSNRYAARMAAFGISVFVTEEFARFITSPPYPWAGAELVARTLSARCPILTDSELAQRNAGEGVSLFVWSSWIQPDYRALPEVLNAVMTGFIEEHRGYNLRELISQSDMGLSVQTTLRAGGLIRSDDGRYVESPGKPADDFIAEPHCFHLTRELALARAASWVSTLFVYDRPRIFFTAAERRLLAAAGTGKTDADLASVLGVSVSGVKKTWMSIYRRAAEQVPSLLPVDTIKSGAAAAERGRTKKQFLLAYLQQHPEELRPYIRGDSSGTVA